MSEEGIEMRNNNKPCAPLSANRRSRLDRHGDNRSSMEGLSQINKISEQESQGPSVLIDMQGHLANNRSMPPKSMSLKNLVNSDTHRREPSGLEAEKSAPPQKREAQH